MKILLLSPHKHLLEFLTSTGDTVNITENKIDVIEAMKYDFIISYGYRHIISQAVIDAVNGNAINLHISYLPWNRGADPNLWSFLDGTPKGFTIHYINKGIDTGDIIYRKQVVFRNKDTLATSYKLLNRLMEQKFKSIWNDIKEKKVIGIPQTNEVGSYHKSIDKEPYIHLLYKGWDTPIKDLINKGAEIKCQK